MRSKRDLGILLILTLLASMAIMTLPSTAPQTPVIFRVEPTIVSGVPVGEKVTVDIYIDAPEGSAIVGWVIDIAVDPNVLEPGFKPTAPPITIWAVSGEGGYFLYDWATDRGNTTDFSPGVRDKYAGTIIGIIEGVVGWSGLEQGEGATGTGKLVTLFFKSKSETGYSPIKITKAYYYTSWNNPDEDKRPAGVLHGHYNDPPTLDVAVTSVSTPPSIPVGEIVPIDVNVSNLGAFTSFILSVTYPVGPKTYTIGTGAVTLNNLESKTESFSWDTTGVDPGTYTITAEATLPGLNDVNLANNVATTTVTLELYRVDLVCRSAWPGHHHHVVAKHTWDVSLFGMIKNVGTQATEGKVVFTIEDSEGYYVASVETDPQPLEPGEKVKGLSTVWTADSGDKYSVKAEAWYQDAYDVWQKSPDKPKTFSVTVLPPPP